MDAASIARLELLAYTRGRSYDSYLVMDLDRQHFWSSGNRAVLGFVLCGPHAVVIGGLIGADDARESLLTEFMAHCREHRLTACFGLVPEHDLPLFDRHGFQCTKIGEDALIDLRDCTWRGKPYEWVRRQSNFCKRHGLVCREIPHTLGMSESSSESRDSARETHKASAPHNAIRTRLCELLAISNQFLDRTPHGRTMRYFVGQFDPDHLHRRRVFAAIADAGAGRVEGFVVCTPYRNGKAWGIEMYRSRPDAIRGTIPFLMHATMQAFKNEGVEEASLCLMPAAGCHQRRQPPHSDSWFIHAYIRVTHRYLNFILDTPGIHHFKTRFRPRRENIYCAIWPAPTSPIASIRPLHAMLSTWGTLRFSPRQALGRGLRRLRTRRQRAMLARS